MPWFCRSRPQFAVQISIRIDAPEVQPSALRRATAQPDRIIIPTDLMFSAWRQLFPAERMVVFGGRSTKNGVRVSSAVDVTEDHPSAAHVRASAERIGQSLIDFERTGSHLAVWLHSHPGEGPGATFPSSTDLNQDRDLRLTYSDRLVGIIAVRDGWLRLWGEGIEYDRARICWLGNGVVPVPGELHVFRLALS
jgi:proteasome lid subunit RPN8/RPN11